MDGELDCEVEDNYMKLIELSDEEARVKSHEVGLSSESISDWLEVNLSNQRLSSYMPLEEKKGCWRNEGMKNKVTWG
jgi:hypothetical protein